MLHGDNGYDHLLQLRGRVEILRVESRALRDNGLGDPTVRHLPVYIPPLHDVGAADGLPTLYFLPSFGSDARSVVAPVPWKQTLFQRVDRLIARGAMRPVLVVAVDGWTRLGGSQYVDSVQNGNYAQYILDEVMPAVEAALPARPGARGRAVFGKSSGGFGALHLGLRYPGRIGALAAHSADGYFPYCAQPAFLNSFRELRKIDFDPAAFMLNFEASESPSAAQHETLITLAYAAAYSPRSKAPFDFALPFSRSTGALDADVFAEWLAYDPVNECKIAARRSNIAELALCFLDCGDRDEYGLDLAAQMVAAELHELKNVVVEQFSGGHRGNAARYDRSLLLLSDALYRAWP
jgi:enterochelin esterase family protein